MRPAHFVLILIYICAFAIAKPDCMEFWRHWKTCPADQFPDISRDRLLCFHELNYASEVLISREGEKQSAVLCHNSTFHGDIFDCLPVNDISLLILRNCPFPPAKFDKTFRSENSTLKALEIHYEKTRFLLGSLQVVGIPYLQSLNVNSVRTSHRFNLLLDSLPYLTHLSITNHNFTTLPGKPFINVPQIQTLTISEGSLDNLPADIFSGINPIILDLSLNKLKNFQPQLLNGVHGLKQLNLSHNSIDTIDELLFVSTPQLQIVILDNNNISTLPSALFSKTPNLTVIFLNHNRLENLSESIFSELYHLQVLSLNDNRLTSLPPNVFGSLVSLLWLDLQSNQISVLPDNLFNWLMRLQVLDLSNNRITGLSSSLPFGRSIFLAKINMSGNHFSKFPNVNWLEYNVSHLDLSRNLIRQIVLPINVKPRTSVFLQGNNISTVVINRPLNTESRYFLEGNPFHCNCSLGEFIHFVPYLSVIDSETIKCHTPWYRNHKYVKEFTKESDLCEMQDDCPNGCQCNLSIDNKVTLDCRNLNMTHPPPLFPKHTTKVHFENNKFTALPDSDWQEITHLYFTNNSLVSLQNWTIPPKIKLLAIDGNKLTDLSLDLMEVVDKSSNIQIYVSDNEWVCDCNSVYLKKWLMRNLPKVQDSMHTYCRNNGHQNKVSLIVESRLDEFVCSSACVVRSMYIKSQLYIVVCIFLYISVL